MKNNKAYSVLMIVGAVLLVIGLLITLFGFLSGGTFRIIEKTEYTYTKLWRDVDDYELWTQEEITSVDLNIAYGKIQFVYSNDKTGISVKDYAKNCLELNMTNGQLQAKDTHWSSRDNFGTQNRRNPVITVYLNSNNLDTLTIELGAGTIDIEQLVLQKLTVSIGAGDCDFEHISADDATFSTGASTAELDECEFKTFNVELGVGDLDFSGDITESAKITGGVGNIKLNLSGKESTYNFECSTGVGSLRINGHHYSGVGSDQNINPTGLVKITIEAGVGDIKIITR